MTDKKDEALKLALEALNRGETKLRYEAIAAIKEALAEQPAQPEQCQCPACKITPHASDCAVHNAPAYQKGSCDCGAQQWNAGVPSLYPEPEPGVSIKATYEQPAQQEPVAWMTPTGALYRTEDVDGCFDDKHIPLYTSPQRKPLTMQERTSIVRANKSFHDKNEIDAYGIIDDVEAAHGIKEKRND